VRKYERRWESSIPEPVDLGEFVGHFLIYGDEAGKLESSDYTSFCGFVGTTIEWERVSYEWLSLQTAWGVPALHMRCIMDPDRPRCEAWNNIKDKWGSDWEGKRTDMLNDFGSVIRHAFIAAQGIVVDVKHFKEMPDSKFKRQQQNPLYMSFQYLIGYCLDRVDMVSKSLPVSIVIDDDEEYAMKCYQFLNALKLQLPRIKERISAFTVGDDHVYPGLQMADMLAYESRGWMVARIKDKDAPPSTLLLQLTRNGVNVPKLADAAFLDMAAKRINEKEI
jgi:hypothetical protein